jgi:uncharacterized pyridoxal phosphate-containing UPF0001 family protein
MMVAYLIIENANEQEGAKLLGPLQHLDVSNVEEIERTIHVHHLIGGLQRRKERAMVRHGRWEAQGTTRAVPRPSCRPRRD